jgi:hypothetical protein
MRFFASAAAFSTSLFLLLASGAAAQAPPPPASTPPPPRVVAQKVGDNLYRLGDIQVDTSRKELSVPGFVNRVLSLEWIATAKDGRKAYESALTLAADAVTFNTALLLIGLDKSHARVPTRHFDPVAPEGDAVEIHVEWMKDGQKTAVDAHELLFDRMTGQTVPKGTWVYTGSTFLPDGRYMAHVDGTLIGFVHSPAPIIEHVSGAGVGHYGSVVLNPNLGLAFDTPVTLRVRSLAAEKKP